ncbi:PREDICTED: uncharacterized protein LOC106812706 [Priapulus caudatus]|uniref:Uncharacterized protein LOC106812706 n=1 Tax=Priapulus caudatus TaxID=37621 RepID=A0ABM1EIW4_PRICU|nr:PREDICTED: uncharacterized protein LOC106812706 [Priapulus caudatus]
MDAAAKNNGKSLNDCIHPGPKLHREIIDVLMRFRKNPIAIVGDIAEMFLQIELAPMDRKYHRFLWRDNENEPVREYEYQRLVFGNSASPYLSQDVIRHHAKTHADSHPDAAESVLHSTYVDDVMDSVISEQSGVELRREITDLLGTAGFVIRKWMSNSINVLRDVPENERALNIELDSNYLPAIKTLGLIWDASRDVFTFKVEIPPSEMRATKRNVFRSSATLYDPLNFLAPFTIRARIYMQQTWVKGIEWDELLPSELSREWRNWFRELPKLTDIKVTRCLSLHNGRIVRKMLHTFVDASMCAYAAAIYLRCEYEAGQISVALVASKVRVAPLKSLSIPRLELSGALIGLRLTQRVRATLKIANSEIIYWSDSLNVLYWIRGESRRYKPFVAHRVGEIHECSSPEQWRYVPTKLNSADLPTRGLSVAELMESDLWWNGPSYLAQAPSNWPKNRLEPVPSRTRAMKCVQCV